MSNYVCSVRVSEELYDKINKNRGSLSVNRFVKRQLLELTGLSVSDYEYVRDFIDVNLKSVGHKINNFTKSLNSENVEIFDGSILDIIEIYLNNLQTIKAKKIEVISDSLLSSKNDKKKYRVEIFFSADEKEKFLELVKSSNMSISNFVRFRLYNSSKYLSFDLKLLRRRLHSDVYRTVNNIKQIIYRSSSLENFDIYKDRLNEYAKNICQIENDIVKSWEDCYGNHKIDAH